MSGRTRSEEGSILTIMRQTAGRFIAHRCLREARSLSYVTLLSLVPFLTVILVLLSSLPFYSSIKERLLFDISSLLLPRTGETIAGYLDSILAGKKPVGVIGILFSVALSFSLILSLSRAVNTIWGTIGSDHILRSFLKFVALIILAPTLIIIAFLLHHYTFVQKALMWLFSLLGGERRALLPTIRTGFARGFSLVLNWGLLAFVYGLIPHGKVKPGPTIVSGVCSGTLWWLMRLGLNLYIVYIPQMNLLYGSLAFIPVFLVWIYGTWIIVLFGVELNYSLHSRNKTVLFRINHPGSV
ncbi:MAG: YihY/virulence factor BrkB family protein [Spirochaetes bacterium]|nr:YihY/virulence factor BrkB family protein [Spirochaetota bacterium]